MSKPIYESGGEPTDGGGGEAVRVRVEEHGEGTDGAVEEPEEEDVEAIAEKHKEIVEAGETIERNKKEKKRTAEEPEEEVETKTFETKEKNKKKKKTKAGAAQEPQEADETKERNSNRKRKAGAGDAHLVSEKRRDSTGDQKESKHDEEERIKKKKKRKVGTADSASKNLIEELNKASLSFRVFLDEETKKAIQLIEPSIAVSITQEVKNFEEEEKEELLLKEARLVFKLAAEVLSEAAVEPSKVVSVAQELKNLEVEKMKVTWKEAALVKKLVEVLPEAVKKKKRKAVNADSVSENLNEQMIKASRSFRILLEEAKKAFQSIELSKVVSITPAVKNFVEEKEEMLLKDADLVLKLAGVLREAEPLKELSVAHELKNLEVEQMKMYWKEAKLLEMLEAMRSPTS